MAMMHHAEAVNFGNISTKEEAYEQVLVQAEGLFHDQRNWVCNLANTASLLWHAYKSLGEPSNQVNWAGFYTVDTLNKDQLILGPFQGKVACQVITMGRGVCGKAAKNCKTMVVPDVDASPGHIACDGDSRSEIVVPVVSVAAGECGDTSSRLVAIIDIDCASLCGFDAVDQAYLEKLAALVARSCDWP